MTKSNALRLTALAAALCLSIWIYWIRVRFDSPTTATGDPPVGTQLAVPDEVSSDAAAGARVATQVEELGGVGAGSRPEPWTIHVVDAHGALLSGATVCRLSNSGLSEGRVSTDKSGSVSITAEIGDTIVATAAGHVQRSADLSAESSHEITLCLADGCSIAGVVIASDGHAVGEGVAVLAWPSSRFAADTEAARLAMAGDPRTHVTATAADGTFTLENLELESRYSVACGGRGLLQRKPIRNVLSGTSNVVVEVDWGYGASLCLQEPSGIPVEPAVLAPGAGTFEAGSAEADVHPIIGSSVSAVLSGVEQLAVPTAGGCQTFLYACPRRVASLDRNFYAASLPGYEPVHVTFSAEPIDTRLPMTTVTFRKTAAGFGSVIVKFVHGSTESGPAEDDRTPRGLLLLTPEAGAALSYPLRAGKFEDRRVDGIPVGTYRARFVDDTRMIQVPEPSQEPIELVVGNQPCNFEVALPSLGTLEFQVSDAAGRAYSGDIMVQIGRPPRVISVRTVERGQVLEPGTRIVENVLAKTLSGPPYRLGGIAPGEHYCILVEPFLADARGYENSVVLVRGGAKVTVEFRRPE